MSANKKNQISDEDRKLLEIAKKAKKDNEVDIDLFISLLEDEYQSEYNIKKEQIDGKLEEEKVKKEEEFIKDLQTKHDKSVKEIKELEENVKNLETQKTQLENENQTLDTQKQRILDKAQADALTIIDKAKEDAKKQNSELLTKIKERQDKLDKQEETNENRALELDAKEMSLNIKENSIKKYEEVYETANPVAVEMLEKRLLLCTEEIGKIREEYEESQKELNKLRIQNARFSGVSIEEIQSENEYLRDKITELENKCNKFSEQQLNDMLAAYESKDDWLTQIRNLQNDNAAKGLELTRLNNSIMEYEQLKAQLDLLRTLNDHLREELNNSKRMLESNVGEICPALSAIDIEETAETGDSFARFMERKNAQSQKINKLNVLAKHVREYAASRSKPLHYSEEDICAFIAGLAASPISILQGMSGTGKTSLPKIFVESIMGEISVVPVESSWRDRNELLGYYNDFSKKFTAKEFTCDLYRAGCERYENTIYFIVLDEMNLSRVEYYFADFLSVLEDKKDNWKIRLVDTDMRQLPTEITDAVIKAIEKDKSEEAKEIEDIVGKLYPNNTLSEEDNYSVTANDKLKLIKYLSDKKFKNKTKTRGLIGGPQKLIDGNTVRIPQNVWFVGTANRDESTFEITDKVYDRAQVLNFNERATGKKNDNDIQRIFVSFGDLEEMFNSANKKYPFKAEEYELLKKIESILKQYFKLSYGNRIQDQMDKFVPIYLAARGASDNTDKKIINEAIDFQITNKVLRKLEYEEINKDAAQKLRNIFEQNGLKKAKEFIDWKTGGVED